MDLGDYRIEKFGSRRQNSALFLNRTRGAAAVIEAGDGRFQRKMGSGHTLTTIASSGVSVAKLQVWC